VADYVSVAIDQDPTEIESDIYTYIQSWYPDWDPETPQLAVVLSEAFAQEVADARYQMSDVPPAIFRYFGRLVGIVPLFSAPATAMSTWTMIDNLGHTIPANTSVRINISGDDFASFSTAVDVVVPPGSTTTAVGEVQLIADQDGAEGNGLTSQPELLTVLDYINPSGISLVGATANGQDEEDDDSYLNRLSTRLQLLADRPILPRDFEIYVLSYIPGVARCLCLNLFDPANGLYNNERTVTMVSLDAAGVGVSGPVKTQVANLLDAAREVNFVVKTMDPTTTAVTVSATVRAYVGFVPADVKANVEAAIAAYLNPARWGQPSFGEEGRWVKEGWDKVRYLELATVINNVTGVNYIEGGITINGNLNTDLVLAGEAPLPATNPTVTISVNAGP
jgi:uncharacterized phage protein gp47/JayE